MEIVKLDRESVIGNAPGGKPEDKAIVVFQNEMAITSSKDPVPIIATYDF